MKRLFLIVSLASLAAAVTAYVAWAQDLLPSSGEHGEDWNHWLAAISVAWKIVPFGLTVSVLSAIAFALWKPRSRSAVVVAACLLTVATAFAVWVTFVLAHLNIQ